MEALAHLYGKPAAWAEANIGEENDLGAIHTRLLAAYDIEAASAANPAPSSQPQAQPGPTAIQGPSQAAGADNEKPDMQNTATGGQALPIQPVAGQGNSAVNNSPSVAPESNIPGSGPAAGYTLPGELPVIPKGIAFYDPRREEKYWSDEQHRFNSLQDALKALSVLYGVPAEWIENHLGKSNDLYEIHQSIRQTLAPD
jgi:hypothetical protein